MKTLLSLAQTVLKRYVAFLIAAQSTFLLLLRLYWGWNFFLTGKGKIFNFEDTVKFFTELGLPLPSLNAALAASTECFGGLLLILGLGTRLVSLPLAFTMVVAYITADREALTQFWDNADPFFQAAPFPFLFATLVLLFFGPGRFSLDQLIATRWDRRQSRFT